MGRRPSTFVVCILEVVGTCFPLDFAHLCPVKRIAENRASLFLEEQSRLQACGAEY